MITHDQFEKEDPRADLIRFKCLVESCVKHSIHVVCVTSNERARFEESSYQGSKVVKVPCVSKILMVQLVCFYFFLLPVLLRMRQQGGFMSSLSTRSSRFLGHGCLNGFREAAVYSST